MTAADFLVFREYCMRKQFGVWSVPRHELI